MVFSSLTFLCIFLPVVFILYGLVRSLKARNILLMIASLIFYAYGEPVYVFLMLGSSLFNYVFALLISESGGKKRKGLLAAAVAANIGVLCVFKYTGMLVGTFNSLTGMNVPVPEIALPIGISFFTFQALSYVIDTYRGVVKAQKNSLYVLLYISFFPQLIAGPIVRYRDIEEAITDRTRTSDDIAEGFKRFIFGLAKKVLIANTMAVAADAVFSAAPSELNALSAWIGAAAYAFQIYYDFSGYSDMAIGLGRMFGFKFRENFDHPYGSSSIREFWRRWHISLSTWFREYLYIPLGGNRRGKTRTVVNKLIVFFLTGLWHGANWTFVIWGLFHGVFLMIEEFIPFVKKIPKWLGIVYMILVVFTGFVIFRADTLTQGFTVIGKMFGGFDTGSAALSFAVSQLTPWFIAVLAAAVIGCAPLNVLISNIKARRQGAAGASDTAVLHKKTAVLESLTYIAAFALLVWCMLRLSGSAYNPFIYFKF